MLIVSPAGIFRLSSKTRREAWDYHKYQLVAYAMMVEKSLGVL